jgi:hypothetical protein
MLNNALASAKAARDGNSDERYAGPAYDALVRAIEKYDAEAPNYTAPSAYKSATEALEAATQAMKDHRSLCDAYDPKPGQLADKVEEFAESKYEATTQYAFMKTIAEKYADVVLYDDAAMTAAIAELEKALKYANSYFTEGPSKANGTTGLAAILERFRLGMNTVWALGGTGEEPQFIDAENALTDDDQVATNLKLLIKKLLYTQLAEGVDVFADETDVETGVTTHNTVDMTVFVKNPNFYITKADLNDKTTDNAPGWILAEGSNGNWTTGWTNYADDEIPADAMWSCWGGSGYDIYQEIDDLPAGVYNIYCGIGERDNDHNAEENPGGGYPENACFYVETTETTDSISPIPVKGQAWYQVILSPTDRGNVPSVKNVVITDGKLKLGSKGTTGLHVFLNDVYLEMTAAATGFNYAMALEGVEQEIITGIEKQTNDVVRAIQMFDLNGQRVMNARKGIVIVKKVMGDGSVRVEKVIKK